MTEKGVGIGQINTRLLFIRSKDNSKNTDRKEKPKEYQRQKNEYNGQRKNTTNEKSNPKN